MCRLTPEIELRADQIKCKRSEHPRTARQLQRTLGFGREMRKRCPAHLERGPVPRRAGQGLVGKVDGTGVVAQREEGLSQQGGGARLPVERGRRGQRDDGFAGPAETEQALAPELEGFEMGVSRNAGGEEVYGSCQLQVTLGRGRVGRPSHGVTLTRLRLAASW